MSPALRIVADRPLFRVESEVCRIVDHLIVVEMALGSDPGHMSIDETRAVQRLVGDVLANAMAVKAAWDAEFDGRGTG